MMATVQTNEEVPFFIGNFSKNKKRWRLKSSEQINGESQAYMTKLMRKVVNRVKKRIQDLVTNERD